MTNCETSRENDQFKGYQNKATVSNKKLRETKSNMFSNYIKNPIEDQPKSKFRGNNPESNIKLTEKQKPLKDDVDVDDEDEDDILIFSERPNEQIPVPHQMSTISQKIFSKGMEQKDPLKKTETLSYCESNTDLICQDDYTFMTFSKERKFNDKEETPDMITKISTPQIEEKLETPESLKGMDRENKELKERYFNNDSGIKNNIANRDNDIFEITIDPNSNEYNKVNDIIKSKSDKLILNKVIKVEKEISNSIKIAEYDKFDHYFEVNERFASDVHNPAPIRKRNSVRDADALGIQNWADDSRDSNHNSKHK